MGLAPLAGFAMMRGALLLLLLCAAPLAQATQHHLLIVTGLGGTEDYRHQFSGAAIRLHEAALAAELDAANIELLLADPLPTDVEIEYRYSDKATLLATIEAIGARAEPGDRVFMVLIGHGNPRGDGAAFNLAGPDITATELAAALTGLGDLPLVLVNAASSSGPFIKPLSAPGRIVITATASGREFHATLFANYFVAAFADSGADRDKDERVSILEAFDYARREVRREFESDKRILTEHALLDDNGDGDGSRMPGSLEPDGALASRVFLQQPPALALGASPALVAMIERRQQIEASIDALKRRRDTLAHDDYYAELEKLLIDLARLGREIRARGS